MIKWAVTVYHYLQFVLSNFGRLVCLAECQFHSTASWVLFDFCALCKTPWRHLLARKWAKRWRACSIAPAWCVRVESQHLCTVDAVCWRDHRHRNCPASWKQLDLVVVIRHQSQFSPTKRITNRCNCWECRQKRIKRKSVPFSWDALAPILKSALSAFQMLGKILVD